MTHRTMSRCSTFSLLITDMLQILTPVLKGWCIISNSEDCINLLCGGCNQSIMNITTLSLSNVKHCCVVDLGSVLSIQPQEMFFSVKYGVRHSSEYPGAMDCRISLSWLTPFSNFTFQLVLYDWYNISHGMFYPVWFAISLSEWSITISAI